MRFLEHVIAVALLAVLGLAGCSGEKVPTYEPITDPAQLYMRLVLNHGAITMAAVAPYDTLQLAATPLDARGDTLQGLPAPTFHLAMPADSVNVTVSPEGLVTALQPTTGVLVIAELTAAGNVRHADTAMVNVTTDPPTAPLATLSITTMAPDSAVWALYPPGLFEKAGSHFSLISDSLSLYPGYVYYVAANVATQLNLTTPPRVQALDAMQNPMSGLAVEYRTLNPEVADFDQTASGPLVRWNGQVVAPLRTGRVPMVVRATAYGVTKADTLTFTVTEPSFAAIEIESAPGATSLFGRGGTRTIRTYGVVVWLNTLNRSVDLVFDQPEQVVPAPAAWCDWASIVMNSFLSIPDASSHCPTTAGNLTLAQPDSATHSAIWRTAQLQQFTQPGTYTIHDPLTGASGRIIVVDVAHE